ncbi:hypothetical protein GCM10009665_31330 [Kitasatospora nipponensis]|uniref:Dynamin N-terminal domain-containing protein n=1 Tax=Kitasatospora nipponensis TaxID=258049 RepID=A0ABP4GUX7_9ACTN
MPRPLSFREMCQYAEAVESLLRGLDPPQSPEEQDARERVAAAARELRDRAQAPVSVAVVGEYSRGKSLLLGTLLGRPDLLAVDERPVTGNITVLRLRQGPAGSATRLGATTRVHYLSRDQLATCVREILQELVEKVDAQHPGLRAGELLGGNDPVNGPRGWAEFDAWYPCLWGAAVAGLTAVDRRTVAPTHRDTVVELCRIRDALRGQQDVVGAGPLELDTATVRDVLQLPPAEPTPDEPPRARVTRFGRADLAAGGEVLRASFPLVERVEQDVEVGPDDWDISGLLAEQDVQFLDFPGIGAAASYGRDKNLSRRELASVHTILLVLHAKWAYSQDALAFWDMLSADGRSPQALSRAALVAANVFDEVAVPALPAGPLPLEQLLLLADAVNGIHTQAGKYVGGWADRVLAVSAVTALLHYGMDYRQASPATRALIDATRAKSGQQEGRWSQVADRLAAADPANVWTPRLRAFDQDGGLAALRALLESHVRAHGVAQKQERAERSRQKLDVQLKSLRRLLNRDAEAPPEEYRQAAENFGRIREVFDRIARQLDSLREQYPLQVPDGPLPPDSAEVMRQARTAVYTWPQWDQLLERALNDPEQLVTRSVAPVDNPLLPQRIRAARAREEASEDSTAVYLSTFEQLVESAAERNLAAVADWLDSWTEHWEVDGGPLRGWLEPDSDAWDLLESLYARRGRSPGSLDLVRYGLEFAELAEDLKTSLGEQQARYRRDWAQAFPAQRGHALPWHHRGGAGPGGRPPGRGAAGAGRGAGGDLPHRPAGAAGRRGLPRAGPGRRPAGRERGRHRAAHHREAAAGLERGGGPMTGALTIRFRAPRAEQGASPLVLPEGAHQFRLLPDADGYLLPEVLLAQDGFRGHLTAHLPARLEIAAEDGSRLPDTLPGALRTVWAPLEANRVTVDGERLLSGNARLPLHLVHEEAADGAGAPVEPVRLLVSWRVEYSGAQDAGTAHATVLVEFHPPGSAPPAPRPAAAEELLVLRRRTRVADHGRVVAVDFGTTASTVTVVDTRRIANHPMDATQKETLADALQRLTAPPPDAPPAWLRALEELRAEHIVLNRHQQRALSGAQALERLGEAEVATAVLLRIERIRRGAEPALRSWLIEHLHQAGLRTVTTPALEFNALGAVQYPDGAGNLTRAPATALRPVEGDLERRGVSVYDGRGYELSAGGPEAIVGLKRNLFEKPVGALEPGELSPVHLAQHMFHLLIDRAERSGDGAGDQQPMGTALLTYPTSSHPESRELLVELVRTGLSIGNVELTVDEGLAAGLYFLMRDLSADLDQGVEALRAASRPVPGRPGTWQRIMLVVDIGGGTTDIALLELTLRDVTVEQNAAQAFVSGRDYLLEPRILGTIGHGQLGGDLLTLHVLYWLKARMADAARKRPEESGGRSRAAQVAEEAREHRESLVGPALRRDLQRLLPSHWVGESGTPLALTEAELAKRRLRFHDLWQLAEQAKQVLGQEAEPFHINQGKLLKVATSEGLPVSHLGEGLSLPVEEFRTLVEPALAQAAEMAATLVTDAFRRMGRDRARAAARGEQAPPEPVLDMVVLAGRTSAMLAVRRALESALLAARWKSPEDDELRPVAWNPTQLFTETGYLAKQATSIGAAWAHVMSGYRGHGADRRRQAQESRPAGEGQEAAEGQEVPRAPRGPAEADTAPPDADIQGSELGIVTGGLFACLPCDFELAAQGGLGHTLFESGTPYREIGADGTLGLRSGWRRVVRRIEVHRPRAGSRSIQWGVLETVRRAAAEQYRLRLPAWDFDGEPLVRYQVEIDNQLNLFVDFCYGRRNHYHVGGPREFEEESVLRLAGAADGTLLFDAELGVLAVPGTICAAPVAADEPGFALTEVFPAWQPGADGLDLDYLPELFHTAPEPDPQVAPVPGRIRDLELRPQSGYLYFYLRPPVGPPAYLGRLVVPPANAQVARDIFKVSLDAAGRLRLHRGEIPYPQVGSLGAVEEHPGWVYRTGMDRGMPDFENLWDPFNGRH